jgi:hypothetical protein
MSGEELLGVAENALAYVRSVAARTFYLFNDKIESRVHRFALNIVTFSLS